MATWLVTCNLPGVPSTIYLWTANTDERFNITVWKRVLRVLLGYGLTLTSCESFLIIIKLSFY